MKNQAQIQKNKFTKKNIYLTSNPTKTNMKSIKQPEFKLNAHNFENKEKAEKHHHHFTHTTVFVPQQVPCYPGIVSPPKPIQVNVRNPHERMISKEGSKIEPKKFESIVRQEKQPKIHEIKTERFQKNNYNEISFLRKENKQLVQQNTLLKVRNSHLNETINKLNQQIKRNQNIKKKKGQQDQYSTEYLQSSTEREKQQTPQCSRLKRIKSQTKFANKEKYNCHQNACSDCRGVHYVKCCNFCLQKIKIPPQNPVIREHVFVKKQEIIPHYDFRYRFQNIEKQIKVKKFNLDDKISQLKQENGRLKKYLSE